MKIDDINNILRPRSGGGRFTPWLIGAGVLLLGSVAWWLYVQGSDGVEYRTAELRRGDLRVTVSATGNLQPTTKVDVGSELSGTIAAVFVDDNDTVTQGQELARLDTRKLRNQLTEAQASLAAAEAQVLQARASAAEARANLERLQHVARLSGGKVPAPAELDAAKAALKRTEAATTSARAAVEQLRAAAGVVETNIGLSSIRSPINGIVLARLIEPGQTVAAQMQAPILFTLAENLTQMKLEVAVDEADVAQVKEGQPATFTVDAWPGREYPSHITRVGFGSQEQEGVISYKTVLTVDNDDLSLRPGMTATAEIETDHREGVLLVPNAALRYIPAPRAGGSTPSGGLLGALLPRHPASMQRPGSAGNTGNGTQRIWVLQDRQPRAVQVHAGASDGSFTEVSGEELREGMAVIVERTEKRA